MQDAPDVRAARLLALEERRRQHAEWKRHFFQSRPPPSCLGERHRWQQQGPKGGLPLHHVFQQAKSIVAAEKKKPTDSPPADEEHADAKKQKHEFTHAEDSKEGRHEAWLTQMRKEGKERNPFSDSNIRTNAQRTVIMANLHPETIDQDLRTFADQFGRVTYTRIVRDKQTGKSRRYAFVEFGLVAEARKAISFSEQKRLRGHVIVIDREKGREAHFTPVRIAAAQKFVSTGAPTSAEDALTAAPASAPSTSAQTVEAIKAQSDDDFLNALLS